MSSVYILSKFKAFTINKNDLIKIINHPTTKKVVAVGSAVIAVVAISLYVTGTLGVGVAAPVAAIAGMVATTFTWKIYKARKPKLNEKTVNEIRKGLPATLENSNEITKQIAQGKTTPQETLRNWVGADSPLLKPDSNSEEDPSAPSLPAVPEDPGSVEMLSLLKQTRKQVRKTPDRMEGVTFEDPPKTKDSSKPSLPPLSQDPDFVGTWQHLAKAKEVLQEVPEDPSSAEPVQEGVITILVPDNPTA